MAIEIRLPLPARELSPNARVHHRIRAQAITEARLASFYLVGSQLAAQGRTAPNWGCCIAVVQIIYPNRLRRDTSNTFSALKAAWDSFTDAKIWRDDQYVTWYIPPARVNKTEAGVIVIIEETIGEQKT